MAVSVGAEPARAKATSVSRERFQMPVGGGRAWPGDQWAADVTNVVKPTRFKSPRKDPCDKRRQSKPKNRHFQRKSHWIDDVCNNTHPSTPKTQRTRRDSMATLKPTTPLHPKTEPKRPFRTRKGDGGFNPTRARARASRGDDGFRQPAQLAYRAWLRHPHVATSPLPRKLACNSIG